MLKLGLLLLLAVFSPFNCNTLTEDLEEVAVAIDAQNPGEILTEKHVLVDKYGTRNSSNGSDDTGRDENHPSMNKFKAHKEEEEKEENEEEGSGNGGDEEARYIQGDESSEGKNSSFDSLLQ